MAGDSAFINPQPSNDSVQAQYELRVDPDMALVFGLTETEIARTVSAIRDALRLRIRPVMMTMVSTVFGGLP